jgi:hypothetical protein
MRDGAASVVMYSERRPRIRNLESNPRVALNSRATAAATSSSCPGGQRWTEAFRPPTAIRTTFGIHCSHEQIPPSRLLAQVRGAEAAGFRAAMSSDHFLPWSERQREPVRAKVDQPRGPR